MSLTQTIISPNHDSVLICKEFPNSTGIITSFVRSGNDIISNIRLPQNRVHRVKKIYDIIPELCSFKTANNEVVVDCISPINENTDIFSNVDRIESGLFHFDLSLNEVKANDKSTTVCDINPRLLIRHYENIEEKILDLETKPFNVNKVKIFTVMLIRGYLTCITNYKKSILQMVINKPDQHFIGSCLNNDNKRRMINNIRLVWPIFKTKRSKNIIKINLNDDLDLSQSKHPILVQFERELNSNQIRVFLLGESVYIK